MPRVSVGGGLCGSGAVHEADFRLLLLLSSVKRARDSGHGTEKFTGQGRSLLRETRIAEDYGRYRELFRLFRLHRGSASIRLGPIPPSPGFSKTWLCEMGWPIIESSRSA